EAVGGRGGLPQPACLAAPRGPQSGGRPRQERLPEEWHPSAADDERRPLERPAAAGVPGTGGDVRPAARGDGGTVGPQARDLDAALRTGLAPDPDRRGPGDQSHGRTHAAEPRPATTGRTAEGPRGGAGPMNFKEPPHLDFREAGRPAGDPDAILRAFF